MCSERSIIVIDTNVLLDWLVFGDPSVAALTTAVQSGAVRWLACENAIAELEHVLTREPFSTMPVNHLAIAETIHRHAMRVAPVGTPPAPKLRCTDPDDQKFLDLALHAGADWLVSRDKALLRLARKAAPLGLRIVAPANWEA